MTNEMTIEKHITYHGKNSKQVNGLEKAVIKLFSKFNISGHGEFIVKSIPIGKVGIEPDKDSEITEIKKINPYGKTGIEIMSVNQDKIILLNKIRDSVHSFPLNVYEVYYKNLGEAK